MTGWFAERPQAAGAAVRSALFLLLLFPLLSASSSGGVIRLTNAMNCLCAQLRSLMPPLAMLLVLLAAVVYGAGRIFGSEMGSKASAMAAFMIVAALLASIMAIAGPDILRMLSNQPGMATACDLSVCTGGGTAAAPAPAPPETKPASSSAPLAAPTGLSCGTLDSPGAKYALDGDVSSIQGASCFSVRADNVTLDCRGHWITARSPQDGAGQYGIYSNYTNTTILNCRVKDFQYGIYLEGAANATLRGNTLEATIANGTGVYAQGAPGVWMQTNSIAALEQGVELVRVSGAWVGYNNITSDGIGVRMNASSGGQVRANIVQASRSDAMRLEGNSSDNAVALNDLSSYGGDALNVENGSSNRLFNNTLSASTQAAALAFGPESAGNMVYYNDFLSGQFFVDNAGSGNMFNTSADGRAQGNRYAGADLGRLNDHDGDGFAESGADYPYSKRVARARWNGTGMDYGPMMQR
ncbi:Right handed beta helix region [uncultured archaeon]|nr:Right handed beta helix region [uncultured archaeon]